MPVSLPLITDWPGASLMRRFRAYRQQARVDAALLDAVVCGQANAIKGERIRAALNDGANPNRPFGHGSVLPLEWAVENHLFEVVIDLLQAGANPNPERTLPATAMTVLYPGTTTVASATEGTATASPESASTGDTQVSLFTALLLTLGARLRYADRFRNDDRKAQEQGLATLHAFLAHGVDPTRVRPAFLTPPGPLTSPLHLLAYVHPSLAEVPQELLVRLDTRLVDAHGDTAAHIVVRHGEDRHRVDRPSLIEGVLALARAGADLQAVNHQGVSPLGLLAQRVLNHAWKPHQLVVVCQTHPELDWSRMEGGSSPLNTLSNALQLGVWADDTHEQAYLKAMVSMEELRALREAGEAGLAEHPATARVRHRARL